ncbi:MAG TPA: thioredoxin domain-containing protein [Thermoanaerobaculia bacterium]|nr:thioredoxin domain-containing protein [Thermoanaerobaculia bacterium]
MKSLALATLASLVAACSFAADAPAKPASPSEKIDRLIRDSLPNCADAKITLGELPVKLPLNFNGNVVRVESEHGSCTGQYVSVSTPSGGYFFGIPWFLTDEDGKTIEERLKTFTWKNLQENMTPVVDRNRTPYGLFKVTLMQQTERGKIPMEGEVDPDGRVFFFGHFRPMTADVRNERTKAFEPFVANAPKKGAEKAQVTVIEFSDFECPSCKHASGYLEPILAKHGDQVRYVRFDLPLVTHHPWAFAAAMAGRAVYRQKPEAFWDFKKAVYENQDKLTSFTFDDFARGFAQDHELNLEKYDADLASDAVREEILKGVGAAFSNDIRATPTYVVNGTLVDAGEGGKDLAKYVESLLAK